MRSAIMTTGFSTFFSLRVFVKGLSVSLRAIPQHRVYRTLEFHARNIGHFLSCAFNRNVFIIENLLLCKPGTPTTTPNMPTLCQRLGSQCSICLIPGLVRAFLTSDAAMAYSAKKSLRLVRP